MWRWASSIIYGTIGVINLAHGEFIMLGAYAAWALKTYVGLSLLPGLVLIFLGVGLFGWLVERILLRRLYKRPLDTILATWGIGVVLQQVVRLTVGGELRYVELPPSMAEQRVDPWGRDRCLSHFHLRGRARCCS